LLPALAADRALVRSMALVIACEVHPIQNLRVLNYFRDEFKHSNDDVNRWAQHWIDLGLAALQDSVISAPMRGRFCFGDAPSLADICLVPQLANARRFGCDLAFYPRLLEIEANCIALPAFAAAVPEKQPDAE